MFLDGETLSFETQSSNLSTKLNFDFSINPIMNNAGEVIFVRNGGDLQSERGGMSIDDMVNKWAGKDKIQKTFVESGTNCKLGKRVNSCG